jgi:hypothetical protein
MILEDAGIQYCIRFTQTYLTTHNHIAWAGHGQLRRPNLRLGLGLPRADLLSVYSCSLKA